VLAALNDEVVMVRLVAIDALLAWPGDDTYVALMNVVQLAPEAELRVHAINTLRKFPPNPRVLSFLSETLLHPEHGLRWSAFAGLQEYQRSMPAEHRAVCLRRLDTTEPELAKRLANELVSYYRDDPQVRQTLLQVMRRGNDAVITEAFGLLSVDNPRDAELMIHALYACDDLGLGQGMLNSGNPKLAGVARAWAAEHGVGIIDRRGGLH
jgi:HEAT repeat protein